jgi:bla regulator protein blaR1
MIPDYMRPFADHLWQSTLFAIAVWVIMLALQRNRAAVRHRLWLAASVKFLVPFSVLASIGSHFQWQTTSVAPPLPLSMMVETISQPFSASSPSVISAGTTTAPPASRFPAILIGVWMCGVAASLLWWFIRWRQVRRVVRLATPAHLSGPLRVMYGPVCFEPGVFGIFRPVLLLPEGITHKTGIAGRFNFHLAYAHSGPPSDTAATSEPYPLIFTVVDQLGLKLEPSQGPYGEVLVVDSVEKPTEN